MGKRAATLVGAAVAGLIIVLMGNVAAAIVVGIMAAIWAHKEGK
jgi:hypothetical protein